jgi:hypothetical protein
MKFKLLLLLLTGIIPSLGFVENVALSGAVQTEKVNTGYAPKLWEDKSPSNIAISPVQGAEGNVHSLPHEMPKQHDPEHLTPEMKMPKLPALNRQGVKVLNPQ